MRSDQNKDGSWNNDFSELVSSKSKSKYNYNSSDETITSYSPKAKKNAPKFGDIIHMCDVGPCVDDFTNIGGIYSTNI